MKPIAPVSELTFPLAAGLASLPLWMEAPLWGAATSLASAAWAFGAWRREVDRRPPLPDLEIADLHGEPYEPIDVAIDWRTLAGEFPAFRRGWRASLTESDLWLAPIRPSTLLGGDRDYVRISRLDVAGCVLASETEVRVRFLDEEHRAQEIRLLHVPRARALAAALGYSEADVRKSWIV